MQKVQTLVQKMPKNRIIATVSEEQPKDYVSGNLESKNHKREIE